MPFSRREIFGTLFTALIIAILYRYWLATPALRYLSMGQWRFLAILVAAACGGVSAMRGLRVIAVAFAVTAGLLLGGAWAAWRFPGDLQISVGAAFVSHLESFWREVIILTASATVVAFCCSRYAKRRLTGTN